MATNISTMQVLKRLNDLIKDVHEKMEEIYAIRRDVLIYHLASQKRQGGKYPNDYYNYDKKNKKYIRMKNRG